MDDVRAIVERIEDLVAASGGLVVFTTLAPDGAPHSSVVNAGAFEHPVTKEPVVAMVAVGGSLKLRHLARDPRTLVVFRDGSRWTAVRGEATIIGPDHPHPSVPAADLPELMRAVYRVAGGGEHPDWAEYDAAMTEGRRALVLVSIDKSYGVYWAV